MPYIPKNKISKPKYTNERDFIVKSSRQRYVGEYVYALGKNYIFNNGEIGEELVEISKEYALGGNSTINPNKEIRKYSNVKPNIRKFLKGTSPVPVAKPTPTEEDYKKAYAKAIKQIEGGFEPVKQQAMSIDDAYGDREIYNYNQGGLASIKKFNEGGINYLPSKVDHNEKDATNYVRATGYVEDGSGTGDKDEDTMLAQLADGEFVTRADGVLGAGIINGGNPNSIKDMREKGAAFFYDQQRKYKRVFDLLKEYNGIDKIKN